MKKIICIIFYLLFNYVSIAQNHDNIWIIGYSTNYGQTLSKSVGFSLVDYSKKSTNLAVKSNMEVDETFACISDKAGKLAFYTNGQLVENFNHDTLKNALFFQNKSYGWTIVQGTLILPYPEKDSLYLVMYQGSGFLPNTNGEYGIKNFYYGTIDMSKNSGKGELIEKNKSIFNYIPAYGKLSAVKHGNGVDWWIIVMEYKTNKFHRYILSKDGLKYGGVQSVGVIDPEGVGASVFSPDGTKYARYDDIAVALGQSLDVYDFDRCSGLLSNNRRVTYKDKGGAGVVFSPNSRFLYVGLGDEIRQYDMQITDLKKSEKPIAKRDNYTSCGGVLAGFYNGQLAPDGKIYFCTDGCSKVLHIIHKPDLAGTTCDVELHGLTLPTHNFKGLGNFPNFKLGKMAGCTTSLNDETEKEEINIYPNPAQNQITFKLENQEYNEGSFLLSDLQGRQIATYPLLPNQEEHRLDISQLQNGIYIWQLVLDDKVRQSGKVVVLKE